MGELEIVKFIKDKTLEELRPKGDWSGMPAERAPYALKMFHEKVRVVEKIRELEEGKCIIEEGLKKMREEYNDLSRL